MTLDDITFREITRAEAKPYIEGRHYLHRMPPVSYAYGAYLGERLIGVLTIGKPPSNSLCSGVCGEELSPKVYELNRLYTVDESPPNTESKLIGYALQCLKPLNLIIVSYADGGMGHHGYIYQATNWIYTGESARRTEIYVGRGGHSRTYSEAQRLFAVRKIRSIKHRYINICGDKRFRREVLGALRYPIVEEYPKGDNRYYGPDGELDAMLYHKHTGEQFRESEFRRHPSKYLSPEELDYYIDVYILGLEETDL